MPRTKQLIKLDNEVKVTQKRKTIKPRKSKHIITKDMIAEAAYYKAEQRDFDPGLEEHYWFEAEIDLNSELRMH